MKQIQPKRIANPSNCGEEIAAKDIIRIFSLNLLCTLLTLTILGVTARVKIVKMTILMHQYSC